LGASRSLEESQSCVLSNPSPSTLSFCLDSRLSFGSGLRFRLGAVLSWCISQSFRFENSDPTRAPVRVRLVSGSAHRTFYSPWKMSLPQLSNLHQHPYPQPKSMFHVKYMDSRPIFCSARAKFLNSSIERRPEDLHLSASPFNNLHPLAMMPRKRHLMSEARNLRLAFNKGTRNLSSRARSSVWSERQAHIASRQRETCWSGVRIASGPPAPSRKPFLTSHFRITMCSGSIARPTPKADSMGSLAAETGLSRPIRREPVTRVQIPAGAPFYW